MKIIFDIAKAELRYLFYSPIAWVILICFFVLGGMQFLTPLMNTARLQEVEVLNNPNWIGMAGPLTYGLFKKSLETMSKYLYLFIPLLTMGAIGREVNVGSMTLLTSSPIRTREIVLGKYLGLSFFIIVMISSMAVLLMIGYFSIENAELYWFISMLLGFFLLASSYVAIGLFVSCLTNYQIMAGIGTFVLFYLLEMAGESFQQYDFVRDLTWFLSLKGRTEFMQLGLITTRDVCYFILIIILFLGLSIIKLKSTGESVKKSNTIKRYLLLSFLILILGYFSSRPGAVGYLDVTRDQRNTLDAVTRAVIKKLDGSPIDVTFYTNLLDINNSYAMPSGRNKYIWNFWEKYLRFYPNINFHYRYYYNRTAEDSVMLSSFFGKKNKLELAKSMAKMNKVDLDLFESPEQIDKSIDLSEESYKIVMQLKYKEKKTFLRTYPSARDPWPYQYNVSGAIKELVEPKTPKVLFATGHYERSPWRFDSREHGGNTNERLSRHSLINLGVSTDTTAVLSTAQLQAADVLVIADPRTTFTTREKDNIARYLAEGGNAIIYGEPGKQHIINEIINKLGVQMEDGIMVLPRQHVETTTFTGRMTKAGNYMAQEPVMQLHQKLGRRTAMANFKGTGILSYIEQNGFKIEPIVVIPGTAAGLPAAQQSAQDTTVANLVVDVNDLKKDDYGDRSVKRSPSRKPRKDSTVKLNLAAAVGYNDIWMERGVFVPDSAAPIFSEVEGDYRRSEYVVAIKLQRTVNNKEQRIVIAADADFMSVSAGNGGSISLGLYSWLLNNEYPVYTKYILPKDTKLTIGKQAGIRIWYLFVYVIPGLLLATGGVILIRRMRK